MEYVLLLVGFVLLVKGADFFVEGSSSLAKILKVPSVIIGLTIVAMGTSAPEASVSINAALGGSNDIAISNVVGSNIFNGLVVVGICAFLSGFQTNAEILKRDMPVNILVTLILCLMFLDGTLGRVEGFLLLAGMVLYITCMIRSALRNREEGEVCKVLPLPKSILFMGGGLAAVIFGGDLVVDNACIIATNFGVSQNFIGLTIIAIGTSLPELVTSIVATRKGDSGLALGNAVGSNLQYPVYPRHVRCHLAASRTRRICDRLRPASLQRYPAVCFRENQTIHEPCGGRRLRVIVCRLHGISVCKIRTPFPLTRRNCRNKHIALCADK